VATIYLSNHFDGIEEKLEKLQEKQNTMLEALIYFFVFF